MSGGELATYCVRVVLERATFSTCVTVPYRDDDDPAYNDDDSAIDVAVRFFAEFYGIDLDAFRWCDVVVELEGVTR
jgi:hypothetical protein